MGFDIAVVVAIDLVLAVGLLQIQNCLDSAKAKKEVYSKRSSFTKQNINKAIRAPQSLYLLSK